MVHIGYYNINAFAATVYAICIAALLVQLGQAVWLRRTMGDVGNWLLAEEWRKRLSTSAWCLLGLILTLLCCMHFGQSAIGVAPLWAIPYAARRSKPSHKVLYDLGASVDASRQAQEIYVLKETERFKALKARVAATAAAQDGQLTKDGLSIKRFVRLGEEAGASD